MQKTKLKKAEIENVEQIVELLKESNYSYENFFIKKIEDKKIYDFVKNNLEFFTVFLINEKVKGFSIAYPIGKVNIKKDFFESNYTFLDKLKKSFLSKNYTSENKENYIIDYIYFDESIKKNNEIFLKYLEIEKIRKNTN